MFFRNQKPHEWTFDERLANLTQFRFEVGRQSGGALVTRDGCGAMVEDLGGGQVKIGKAGVLLGGEIASLVSRGYELMAQALPELYEREPEDVPLKKAL